MVQLSVQLCIAVAVLTGFVSCPLPPSFSIQHTSCERQRHGPQEEDFRRRRDLSLPCASSPAMAQQAVALWRPLDDPSLFGFGGDAMFDEETGETCMARFTTSTWTSWMDTGD